MENCHRFKLYFLYAVYESRYSAVRQIYKSSSFVNISNVFKHTYRMAFDSERNRIQTIQCEIEYLYNSIMSG